MGELNAGLISRVPLGLPFGNSIREAIEGQARFAVRIEHKHFYNFAKSKKEILTWQLHTS